MSVKLNGPNGDFTGMVKKGQMGPGKGSADKTDFESVARDGEDGKQEHPDTNEGADRQNHEQFGDTPKANRQLEGIFTPNEGPTNISRQEGFNKNPRKFVYPAE